LTAHHLIVAHEVTNVGNDTAHLSNIAGQTKAALGVEKLEAIADRGYFDGGEILACECSKQSLYKRGRGSLETPIERFRTTKTPSRHRPRISKTHCDHRQLRSDLNSSAT